MQVNIPHMDPMGDLMMSVLPASTAGKEEISPARHGTKDQSKGSWIGSETARGWETRDRWKSYCCMVQKSGDHQYNMENIPLIIIYKVLAPSQVVVWGFLPSTGFGHLPSTSQVAASVAEVRETALDARLRLTWRGHQGPHGWWQWTAISGFRCVLCQGI